MKKSRSYSIFVIVVFFLGALFFINSDAQTLRAQMRKRAEQELSAQIIG